MLLDPSKSSWREQSVEFCGGTHLSNTSEAVAFCVLEEGAVAKGIRRISALTGQEALEAKKLGSQLQARVDNLRANDEAEMKALSLYLSEVFTFDHSLCFQYILHFVSFVRLVTNWERLFVQQPAPNWLLVKSPSPNSANLSSQLCMLLRWPSSN